MLPRVDIGRFETVRDREVQRSRRDNSKRILERCSKAKCDWLVFQTALGIIDAAVAHVGDVTGALTVEVQFVDFFQIRLRSGGKGAGRSADGQSGEGGATLEESSTIRLRWVH